jgi:hypothetical protein
MIERDVPNFTGAAIGREHSQWKLVFAAPVAVDSSILFCKFRIVGRGQISEAETNFDTIIDALCDGLADDVLQQLHGEITFEQK